MMYVKAERRAFSLVELIVVLAVISVLAILIFGGISHARQMAMSSKCMSNLRTIGQAALSYFNDNGGELLPTAHWPVFASWHPVHKGMRDYLGIETDIGNITNNKDFFYDSILTCPAMQLANPEIHMTLHNTYSINRYLFQRDPHSSYNNLPQNQRPLLKEAPMTLQGIRNPSKMWMFTDASRLKGGGAYSGGISTIAYSEFMTFPHNNRNNFVFADGHLEQLTRDEFERRAAGSIFWGKTN